MVGKKNMSVILCVMMIGTVFVLVGISNAEKQDNVDMGISGELDEEHQKGSESSSTIIALVRDPQQVDGTAYAFVTVGPNGSASQESGRGEEAAERMGVLVLILIIVTINTVCLIIFRFKKKRLIIGKKTGLLLGFALIAVVFATLPMGVVGENGDSINITFENPNPFPGGSTIGTITVNNPAPSGGINVLLSVDNPYVIVPESVSISEWETQVTFYIDILSAAEGGMIITITAQYNIFQSQGIIIVRDGVIDTLSIITENPYIIVGDTVLGKVSINDPAPPTGYTVNLNIGGTIGISVPSSVIVLEGKMEVNFNIDATSAITGTDTITTSYNTLEDQLTIYIKENINIESITVNNLNPSAGDNIVGTITINNQAPTGGIFIELNSTNSYVSLPPGILIPEGETQVYFSIDISSEAMGGIVTITASYFDVINQHNFYLKGDEDAIVLIINNSYPSAGEFIVGTILLKYPTPTNIQVNLNVDNIYVTVPPNVLIQEGSSQTSFDITISEVAEGEMNALINATFNDYQAYHIITINWENEPPVANAGPDQMKIIDEIVHFDGSNSFDPDGSIVSYDWDFGDGSPHGTGITTSHVYTIPGNNIVTLTIEDDHGFIGIDTMIVKVSQIKVVPKEIEFGNVWVQSGVTKTVTISNVGKTDMTINDISLDSDENSDFIITQNPLTKPIYSPENFNYEITAQGTEYGGLDESFQWQVTGSASTKIATVPSLGSLTYYRDYGQGIFDIMGKDYLYTETVYCDYDAMIQDYSWDIDYSYYANAHASIDFLNNEIFIEIYLQGDPNGEPGVFRGKLNVLGYDQCVFSEIIKTVEGSGIVNANEGNKDISIFDAYPRPQNEFEWICGIPTYTITDDNPKVSTWIEGNHVFASTDSDGNRSWEEKETGSTTINLEENDTYIITSTLEAPNGDTSWSATDDNPFVDTWMVGNQLYAKLITDYAINYAIIAQGTEYGGLDESFQWQVTGKATTKIAYTPDYMLIPTIGGYFNIMGKDSYYTDIIYCDQNFMIQDYSWDIDYSYYANAYASIDFFNNEISIEIYLHDDPYGEPGVFRGTLNVYGYDCMISETTKTVEGFGIVNANEGNKNICIFDAYPRPQNEFEWIWGEPTYTITDDNLRVSTWVEGSNVYASTDSDGNRLWQEDETGSISINLDENDTYIITSTLEAPNGDTSWSVTDDNPFVDTWMIGNELWGRPIQSPVILSPQQSVYVKVSFKPKTNGNSSNTLCIYSNDLIENYLEIPLNGTGAGIYNTDRDKYYDKIQSAINDADSGDTIIVGDGIYTGFGNKNLDFGGRDITVKSLNGPENCIIDCQGNGKGFNFHRGESNSSGIIGFTIRNGYNVGAGGGIICTMNSSPTIRNCIIMNNTTENNGGGLYIDDYSNPIIIGCKIINNYADYEGGGIFSSHNTYIISNCLIAFNSGTLGGGISCYDSFPIITNCTFTGNVANASGGIYCYGSSPLITNCILWYDTFPEIIINSNGNRPLVAYSNIEGGYDGTNNINADPMFIGSGDYYYHLKPGSPCIDAGDNDIQESTTDLDGNPRFYDDQNTDDTGNGDPPIVDMGACEYISPLAMNDEYYVDEDVILNVFAPGVLGNDTDPENNLTTELINTTNNGTLMLSEDGSFSYTSEANWNGVDTFTYRVNDGYVYSNEATVTIIVNPINDAPIANNQDINVVQETPVNITLNASDSDEDPLTFTVIQEPLHGMLTGVAPNLIYTPISYYEGEDSFAFRANDGLKDSNIGIIHINVVIGEPIVWVSNNFTPDGYNDGHVWMKDAFNNIQDGINGVASGSVLDSPDAPFLNGTVRACSVLYKGYGNKNLDFHGKNITVMPNDWDPMSPSPTVIIDCENDGRGFNFHSGEAFCSRVVGFRIWNGNTDHGSGINIENSSPTLYICTVENCNANYGGGINIENSSPTLDGCTITNCKADYGGGINIINSNPKIQCCDISFNTATLSDGGGIYIHNSDPIISSSRISNNKTSYLGGGIYSQDSSPFITNCDIIDNIASSGGGVSVYNEFTGQISNFTIANSIIIDNTAWNIGGGISATGGYSDVTIVNCTISENIAYDEGGAIYTSSWEFNTLGLYIYNSILWENIPDELLCINCEPTISSSILPGGYPGAIDVDPLMDNDYNLSKDSPCIDAGDNNLVPMDYSDVDYDGNITEKIPRTISGSSRFIDDPFTIDTGAPELPTYPDIVDIGAMEYNPPPVADVPYQFFGYEGNEIVFDTSEEYNPDNYDLLYRWDFENDGVWDTDYSSDSIAKHTWDNEYSGTLKVEVVLYGKSYFDTASVIIKNVAPNVSAGENQFINYGDIVYFSGNFTDPGINDTHTIKWDFGDGNNAKDTLTPNHLYQNTGVYIVKLMVTDNSGDIGTDEVLVLIYIPDVHNIDKDIHYDSIQEAINNADSGNTIQVRPGKYYENVRIDKELTLIGEDKNITIIQGSGTGEGIFMNNLSSVSIEGLTITGFTHGIRAENSFNNNISGNDLSDNGVGLLGRNFDSNTIIDNVVANNRHGIYLRESEQNTITGNLISENYENGIMLYPNSNNNTVINNTVVNNHVGIRLVTSSIENNVSGNTILDNLFGIYVADNSDNNIYGNTASNNHYAIFLINSNNCTVSQNTVTGNSDAISVNNSEYSNINNNTVSNNSHHSIVLYYSNGSNISGNSILNNANGITLYYSPESIAITDNTLLGNTLNGIYLSSGSNNITITGNTISNNEDSGILLNENCTNNTITENIISNNNIGISLYTANDNIFYYNNIIHNTNQLYTFESINTWDNGTGEGNYWSDYGGRDNNGDAIGDTDLPHQDVDNYPLIFPLGLVHNSVQDVYYTGIQEAINDAHSGDTIKIGRGTYYENLVIDKYLMIMGESNTTAIIQGPGSGYGIKLDSQSYVTISDINIIDFFTGIHLRYSYGNSFHNNKISNCSYGVDLIQSDSNEFIGNEFSNNSFGVRLTSCYDNQFNGNKSINNALDGFNLYDSDFTILDYNTISNNQFGIYMVNSNVDTITCNWISDNYVGAYLSNSNYNTIHYNSFSNNVVGIIDPYSSYNSISNNVITGNEIGIIIEDSSENIITGNSFLENDLGISIDETSVDNQIYYNNLIENKVQAQDSGSNSWDDGAGTGNFWSDYDGKDTNKDGVGEDPYGDLDQFPITYPSCAVPPVTDADGPYFGAKGDDITFDASDSYDCNAEDELQYRWDFNNDGIWDTEWSSDPTATCSWDEEYEGTVVVEVTDGEFYDTDLTTVIVKTLEATIIFDPETLNLLSEGEWVTVYIELPKKYDVEDIDLSTILLNGEVPIGEWPWEIGDEDGDKIPDLKVKFDREAVQKLLKVGEDESIVITGLLNDGTAFGGEDRIRVIKEIK